MMGASFANVVTYTEMAVGPGRQKSKTSKCLHCFTYSVRYIEVISIHYGGKLQFSQLSAAHTAYMQNLAAAV